MKRTTCGLVATLALSAHFAWAATSAPVAFVYVASNYSGSNNRVVGYSANADGQLTQIPGSPWADNLNSLAVNGTYLFGSDNVPNDNGRNIYSYRIRPNGALQYLGATNIQRTGSENACNDGENLLVDHSGVYLYVFVVEANCNSGAAYQSFAVNQKTGLLNYVGVSAPNVFTLGAPLTMAADNFYAYAAGGNGSYSAISGFKKGSNGALTAFNGDFPYPPGQPSSYMGYIEQATADSTNHVAFNLYWVSEEGDNSDTIATYAINTTNGNLTTNSTYSNMPTTEVGESTWMTMAPSGKLLAVGGPNGLQIFNFNPHGQATANTGLITRVPIDMMYWDNNNHLYAISNADGAIHVFTVTPTSATEVSGSPYYVAHPLSLIVQPK